MNLDRDSLGVDGLMVLLVALLIFSAYRTWDILTYTLPAGKGWLAILGVAGLDAGLLVWGHIYRKGAQNNRQQNISLGMFALCVVGITVTNLVDHMFNLSGTLENLPEELMMALNWGVPLVIVSNIVAGALFFISAPGRVLDDANKKILAAVDAQVVEILRENTAIIAQEVAPVVAKQRAAELIAQSRRTFSLDGQAREPVNQGE